MYSISTTHAAASYSNNQALHENTEKVASTTWTVMIWSVHKYTHTYAS